MECGSQSCRFACRRSGASARSKRKQGLRTPYRPYARPAARRRRGGSHADDILTKSINGADLTMRSWTLRMRCAYEGEKNQIVSLNVEQKDESGAFKPFAIDVGSPEVTTMTRSASAAARSNSSAFSSA